MKSLSHVQLFATPWTVVCQVPSSMQYSRQGYWSGLPFPSQEIFPTQGLNPGLPLCRQTLYCLNHQGSPLRLISQSVQSLSHVQLFATPWIAARQAFLSLTNSRSSLKLMSIELVMPSSHLILCHPLLLLPPIPPSIRVYSAIKRNTFESVLMRWINLKPII